MNTPNRLEIANALRFLAIDAVEKAKSGHPGAPMGMADMAESLWRHVLKHNPGNPDWPDRDRFVLSNGHASMLIYALLHLTGYVKQNINCDNFWRAIPTAFGTALIPMSCIVCLSCSWRTMKIDLSVILKT